MKAFNNKYYNTSCNSNIFYSNNKFMNKNAPTLCQLDLHGYKTHGNNVQLPVNEGIGLASSAGISWFKYFTICFACKKILPDNLKAMPAEKARIGH